MVSEQAVPPSPGAEKVVAQSTNHVVVAALFPAHVQPVTSAAAADQVIATNPDDAVASAIARQEVISRTAPDHVPAAFSTNKVVAAARKDDVIPTASDDHVSPGRALEPITSLVSAERGGHPKACLLPGQGQRRARNEYRHAKRDDPEKATESPREHGGPPSRVVGVQQCAIP